MNQTLTTTHELTHAVSFFAAELINSSPAEPDFYALWTAYDDVCAVRASRVRQLRGAVYRADPTRAFDREQHDIWGCDLGRHGNADVLMRRLARSTSCHV